MELSQIMDNLYFKIRRDKKAGQTLARKGIGPILPTEAIKLYPPLYYDDVDRSLKVLKKKEDSTESSRSSIVESESEQESYTTEKVGKKDTVLLERSEEVLIEVIDEEATETEGVSREEELKDEEKLEDQYLESKNIVEQQLVDLVSDEEQFNLVDHKAQKFFQKESERSSQKKSERSSQKQSERFSQKQRERFSQKESERSSQKQSERFSQKESERSSQKQSERSSQKKNERFSQRESERSSQKGSERFSQRESERFSQRETVRFSQKEEQVIQRKPEIEEADVKDIENLPVPEIDEGHSTDEEYYMYDVDCGGKHSKYVKLFSAQGYLFIMKRKILETTSRILKRMLELQSQQREIISLHFNEIRPEVMHEFCKYSLYSFQFRLRWKPKFWMYENAEDPYHDNATIRNKICPFWEYEIPRHLVYDMYSLGNFFMC